MWIPRAMAGWTLWLFLGCLIGCSPDTVSDDPQDPTGSQGTGIDASPTPPSGGASATNPPVNPPASSTQTQPSATPPSQPATTPTQPPPATPPPSPGPAQQNDPCTGVTCSGHGKCIVFFVFPLCMCDPGFHTEGSDCVVDSPSDQGGGSIEDAARVCVEEINRYRQQVNAPALSGWSEKQDCANGQAERDHLSGMAHGSGGQCGETGQNECPGWGGWRGNMVSVVRECLKAMWAEGPFGGHHMNMAGAFYSKVVCGFYRDASGRVTSVQDFR